MESRRRRRRRRLAPFEVRDRAGQPFLVVLDLGESVFQFGKVLLARCTSRRHAGRSGLRRAMFSLHAHATHRPHHHDHRERTGGQHEQRERCDYGAGRKQGDP